MIVPAGRPAAVALARARMRGNAYAYGRGPVRRRTGLGDCIDDGTCWDATPVDPTAGQSPSWTPPAWITQLQTTPPFAVSGGGTPGVSPPSSTDWTSIMKAILPGSFTTLQEAIAQPGQVIRGANGQIITGPNPTGAPLNLLGGISSMGSSSLLLIGGLVIGAVLLFSRGGK